MRIQLGQTEIESAIRESIQDLWDTDGRTVTITFTRRGKTKASMELVADIDIVEAGLGETKEEATPRKARASRKAAAPEPLVAVDKEPTPIPAEEAAAPAVAAAPVADIFGSATPTAPAPAELPPAVDGKISLFGS